MTGNGVSECKLKDRNRSTTQQVFLWTLFWDKLHHSNRSFGTKGGQAYLCSGCGWQSGSADQSLAPQLAQAIKMPCLVCLICLLVHATRWEATGDSEAITGPTEIDECAICTQLLLVACPWCRTGVWLGRREAAHQGILREEA